MDDFYTRYRLNQQIRGGLWNAIRVHLQKTLGTTFSNSAASAIYNKVTKGGISYAELETLWVITPEIDHYNLFKENIISLLKEKGYL